VTSRSLKGQTGVTVDEIAKPSFWNDNAGNDVIRHFPASGFYWGGSLYYVGTRGFFWSSSPCSSSYAWGMGFYSSHANSGNGNTRYYGFAVRLFSSGD
ncbi:MAG: hypothetical protein QM237_03410, partial [Bacteroidota bacterium]|nr:hypothetical protein [Bacteroidota bacterium]